MNPTASRSLNTNPRFSSTLCPFQLAFSTLRDTMYHNHPYDGWASSGHGQSSPWPGSPPPSVLGALPYPAAPTPSNLITYHITAFSPSVFNSKVAGPDGQVHFNITTDNEMPGYTVVKNMRNNSIALIEWRSSPFIEIRGLLSKQKINNWLRLSLDRRYVLRYRTYFLMLKI